MVMVMSNNEWVPLKEAAERCGVSYAVVYRHVRKDLVSHSTDGHGVRYVWAQHLPLIKKRAAPKDRKRIPVQLAPNAARHAAWAKLAKRRGTKVTTLAAQLMDEASGYVAPERG